MTPQERRDQRRSVHRKYSMFILRIPRFVRDYGKVARTGPLLEFDPRLGDWADTKNPTHQLEFIRRVALEKIATTDTVKTLEFPTIADALKETTDGYCLVSKTNLATFLRPASGIGTLFEQSQARASLASITLPLAILYKAGELAASVEWVEQIDELELTVVREALKNAGIPTVKTAEADSAAELRHLLQRTLGLATN